MDVTETPGIPILDRLVVLADPIRCRLLRLLEAQELTVSELCAVLQLPQSTVSRHLKALGDEGWLASRRDGTRRLYSMTAEEPAAQQLWQLVREQVAGTAGAQQDQRRLSGVLAARRARSVEFFSSAAGEWDRVRAELFGDRFHLHALLALLDPCWVAGDLGCGTGEISRDLAPFVGRVIAVDGSSEMLEAAARRLGGVQNVEFRHGELESLPIANGALDIAILVLVLPYLPDPGRVLGEAARVLRPGGRILVVDMLPHDRYEYQQQMGHVWLGFSESHLTRRLAAAGFEGCRVRPLPIEPKSKGPSLFVASAVRPPTATLQQRSAQDAREMSAEPA
jgi:SAM-dependent methyltransferase